MNLLALFKWLGHSSVGIYMQKSVAAFAIVETVHLIALAALGGSILLTHLAIIGLFRDLPVRKLMASLFPIAFISLIVMIGTGVLMVSEEALKCYYNPAFRAKMFAFGVALLAFFFLAAFRRKFNADSTPWWLRVNAAVSLLAWLAVGVAGRAIGLL